MPTHKMHMAIANEVNKHLKLDEDMIMIGSVLPPTPDFFSYINKKSSF